MNPYPNSNFTSNPIMPTPPTSNKRLSMPKYIAMISALVASGFLIVMGASILASDPAVYAKLPTNMSPLALAIVSLVALIVALLIQWRGQKLESVPLCLIGFYLCSLVIGAMTALILPLYGIDDITLAAGGTVIIALAFGALGFCFPNFFAKIRGVLFAALIGLIIVELVLLALGVQQGWTDWLVLLVFCGFIGYDFYAAVHVEPTKVNAVVFATSIYLDLINVFLRLLSIFGNSDD